MPQYLSTTWQVDTEQGHEVEIVHRSLPVTDMDDAARQEQLVGEIRLMPDGRLLHYRFRDDDAPSEIVGEDCTIRVYTRPLNQRGESFIPDPTTAKGRARIEATLTDPAYLAMPEEFQVLDISLAQLSTLPGAAGRLGSLAYGISTR